MRRAGRHLEHVVAARGGRRRRRARRSDRRAAPSPKAWRTCWPIATCAPISSGAASRGPRSFSWTEAARAVRRDLRREPRGPPVSVAGAGDPAARAAGRRVALVHDWLTGMRGGEKVLDALCALCPDAHIFTLLHVPGAVSPAASRRQPLHTSFVQHLPRAPRWYRHYLPLFPAAVEAFDLDGFDLVDLEQPLRGEVGRRARPAPATSATATRRCATPGTSSTPTSGRIGWAGPAGWPGRRCVRWPGGTPRRAAGPTAMWRILNMLRGESGATIIVRLPWSRRPSIRCSTRRRPADPSPTYSWSPPSSPTSVSTSRSTRLAVPDSP